MFCLADLAIGEGRVLNPPLLLCYCWFPLSYLLVFALHIEVSYVGCIFIYNCFIFLGVILWSLCSVLLCLLSRSLFQSLFYQIWVLLTYIFFWSSFPLNIFFWPLTFSLYVSLGLKWVSCRQHIYGSCFCIHSVSLCLLTGAFNDLHLK